jgi:hypothetical protein
MIHRRTLLRGALGGAAVAIGLPPLELFFDTHGRALAADGLPRRFGLFFWGNGIIPSRWNPSGEGTDWALSEQLEPLANVKSEITVVSGMNVLTGNSIPHGSGPAGILSGAPLAVRTGDDFTFTKPTIDQVIAAELGKETRFRSIELGAAPNGGQSFNGPNNKNPPESSPHRLFERIFGGGFQAPGEMGMVDPKLRLRRSVLDAVANQATRLRARLGRNDQVRLDQHLGGIRELEQRIARLEENPPTLASCMRPAAPLAEYPDVEGRPQLSAINRALTDVAVMALACDQTRVFSNFFTYPVNNLLFTAAPAGHHQLTHDEPGDQPEVNAIVRQIIGELAYVIEALRAVPEGDGTLLDNCALLATSDTSFGRTHSLEDYPIIIAGTAGGALKKGLHYRSPSGENASKVLLTLIRAMGLRAAEFGTDGGRVDQGLGAIEA